MAVCGTVIIINAMQFLHCSLGCRTNCYIYIYIVFVYIIYEHKLTSVITTELISFSPCCRALLMLGRMERLLVRATQPLGNTLSGYQGKECSCLEKLELVGSFLHHLMHLSTTRLLAESIK